MASVYMLGVQLLPVPCFSRTAHASLPMSHYSASSSTTDLGGIGFFVRRSLGSAIAATVTPGKETNAGEPSEAVDHSKKDLVRCEGPQVHLLNLRTSSTGECLDTLKN